MNFTLLWPALNALFTFFTGCILTLAFLDIKINKKNMLAFTLFAIPCLRIQYFLGTVYSPQILMLCFPLVVLLPIFLLCVWFFKKQPLPVLTSMLFCFILTIPRYFLAMVMNIAFRNPILSIDFFCTVLVIPFFIFSYIVLLNPIQKILKRTYRDILLVFIPMIIFFTIDYTMSFHTDFVNNYPRLYVYGAIAFFVSLIYYYLLIYFYTADQAILLKNQQQLMSLSENYIKKELQSIENAELETRKLRHDMRHYMSLINSYAHLGDTESIATIANQFIDAQDAITPVRYCSNTTINLVLAAYLEPLKAKGIQVSHTIHLPQEFWVDHIDLSIILSNAIENARHACAGIKDPFIQLTLLDDDFQCFIDVKNNYEGTIPFENGIPVNHKKNHGFGIPSILGIVKKYNGQYKITAEHQIFTLHIVLSK